MHGLTFMNDHHEFLLGVNTGLTATSVICGLLISSPALIGVNVFFSCESAEELADFLARSSVNKLRHMEIDLGIDEDTLAAEREYLDSFNQ